MPLPFTRTLDPLTGELGFDQTRSSWLAGDPDAEALVRVFRTDKGTFVPNPDFGFDYGVLQKRSPSSEADIQRECVRATARVVRLRGLTAVSFDVQIQGQTVAIAMTYTTRSGRKADIRVVLS